MGNPAHGLASVEDNIAEKLKQNTRRAYSLNIALLSQGTRYESPGHQFDGAEKFRQYTRERGGDDGGRRWIGVSVPANSY